MSTIEWQWARFDELGNHDLYAMLALRQQVFVVEQACLFQDIDNADQPSHHLLAWQVHEGVRHLAGCLRGVPPGIKFAEASLGRVVCAPWARGSGLGRLLVAQGLARMLLAYPGQGNRIGAQRYLEQFYASFGFETCSAPYLEDGIWHVDMLHAGAAA